MLKPKPSWEALQLFAIYRILLAGVFLLIRFSNFSFIHILSETHYTTISTGFMAVSLFALWLALRKNIPFTVQTHLGISIDVFAILTLMITCGGMISGIGILLIISLAAYSLLTSRVHALIAALTIAILLLGAQYYTLEQYPEALSLYHHTGLLILALIATSTISSWLSNNIRRRDSQLSQQTLKLAASNQLAEHIVSILDTGIVVFDPKREIILINEAAKRLTSLCSTKEVNSLDNFLPPYDAVFNIAPDSPAEFHKVVSPLRFDFHQLPQEFGSWWVVYITDLKKEIQQAQQLKLASLGQLSANIAHELRNPLSAISHAAQLLAEQPLSDEDKALTDIIHRHSLRINHIIENVLTLSKKRDVQKEKINLSNWIHHFLEQHFPQQNNIQFTPPKHTLQVSFNESQLTQVLVNLCENGLRHAAKGTNNGNLTLTLNQDDAQRSQLIITDNGPGICPTQSDTIFEPFYSTESSGTGLGLTIAKELCTLNNAQLRYQPAPTGGAQFHIVFAKEG